jgi:hypothetical protein
MSAWQVYGSANLFWGDSESDEQRREVLCERVKRSNLANAGGLRELLASQNLDELVEDLEAALRVSYLERQQQSPQDAAIDLTR